jgi:hypothetical protein
MNLDVAGTGLDGGGRGFGEAALGPDAFEGWQGSALESAARVYRRVVRMRLRSRATTASGR